MPRLISTKNLRNLRTSSSFIATQGQTNFNFVYNVGYVDVYINGVKLASSEFTATNGTSITISSECQSGDIVEFVGYVKL